MGITLQRKYDFGNNNRKLEKFVDYYFWALDDLQTKLPFICERPKNEIGCIDGNGENYQGHANRGESGDLCESWNSPYLNFVLDQDKIANLGNLSHNFCRNPDGDEAPWCIGNKTFQRRKNFTNLNI